MNPQQYVTAGPVEPGGALVLGINMDEVREAQPTYALRDALVAAIESAKPTNIVLDMSKVRFIGSVGLLAFLGVRRQLEGGRVVLCHMSPPIQKMFAICRLVPSETSQTAPFEVATTVDEARASLRSTR